MKKLISSIKWRIPVYRRNMKLARELSAWKKGLYPPGHYYSPIVAIDSLEVSKQVDYNKPVPGINLNDDLQLTLLNSLKDNYTDSLFSVKKQSGSRYYFENDYFSY